MRPWLMLALFLSPSATLGAFALYMFLHDRQRDRQACRRIVTLIEREEAERFRSGAAFAEAMALQLDEILALPECQR